MNPWIVMAWVVAAGTATGLVAALLWMWLEARGASDPGRFRAAEHFSFERYAVMERLFSAEDLEYLRTQPGATPELAAKWRRESVAVFRAYLAELTRDFHALHAHARHMVAGSRSDSAELAATLVRQQGEFLRARVALEVRLVLFQFGIGKVDAAPLLALLGAMQSDLGRLVPEAAASV